MKFLCPNCKAKYQISDEKIEGRTLKMDCRRCNHPIVIRGDAAPAPAPAAGGFPARSSQSSSRPSSAAPAARRRGGSHVGPAPARSSARTALGADCRKHAAAPAAPARPTALDQWHVAINDVPVGPMKRDEVAQKIGAGAATGDSLVWREGFDDWRPLKDVPELAALLRRPAPAAPAFPSPSRALGGRAAPPAAARSARPPAGRAPAPSAPSRPAPEARPAARGNVVPIGGRLGAAAAPAIDDFSDDMTDDEPTRVGSMTDFAKVEEEQRRAEEEHKRAAEAREREEAEAREEERRAKEAAAAEAAAREAAAREAAAKQAPAAEVVDEDAFDPFASQRAPSPVAFAEPVAPVAPTPSVAVVEQRRRRGLPVGAWIAIAGAMAFGVTLAVMVGIRMFREPQAPLALNQPQTDTHPPATPEPQEAVPDPTLAEPEPEPEPAQPVADPDPEPAAETPERPRNGGGGSTTRPASEGTAARPTTPQRTVDPEAAARLAQFADDGAGAAPLSVRPRNDLLAEQQQHGGTELSAEQLRTVVNRERSAVQRCYETAVRAAGQAPSMRVDVDVTIAGSGTVTSATARGRAFGTLSECIERSVRRWRFPATGATTHASLPFVFQGRD